jgi:release factor glutamine methyltransferase
VSAEAAGHYLQLVERRRGRVPIQHILGTQEFFGISFRVTPAVLIPRPETEGVVEEVLAELGSSPHPRIADVGCGSGCIGVAVAHEHRGASVVAIDSSPAALAVARENALRHGVSERMQFLLGDLLEPLLESRDRIDAVVSNPPYVSDAELTTLEPEVAEHEPRIALAGGADGLAVIGRLLDQTKSVIAPGGFLFMEIGKGQAEQVAVDIREAGLELLRFAPDLSGIPRVAVARRR